MVSVKLVQKGLNAERLVAVLDDAKYGGNGGSASSMSIRRLR